MADGPDFAAPGLRFDKVALRLVERVRGGVHELVPQNTTVVFTVTAPIRLPSKTAEAIESAIRGALAKRSAHVELRQTIHGNGVCIWVISGRAHASNVLGFVHNPGIDPHGLLEMARQR